MTKPYEVHRWNNKARITVWSFAVLAAILILAPLWGSPIFMSRAILLFVYILLAVSWNALAGYAGLMSVGQQAFIGLGAYFSIRLSNAGMPVFAALVLSPLVVAFISMPIGKLMLKLKEGEFAIGMWVLAFTIHLLVNLDPLIQGETGISLIALNAFKPDTRLIIIYLMSLISAIGVLVGMIILLRSRFGAALQAIRDNEEAAASIGIKVSKAKQIVFVFAAFGAALAGSIFLATTVSFQPQSYFGVHWMAYTIFMVIVGGIATFEGAIIGAVIFFVIEALFGHLGLWYLIALGASAIFCALLFPKGIWGYVSHRFGLQLLPIGRILVLKKDEETGNERIKG
jgi:branched-chain amino acid transport system permease protein